MKKTTYRDITVGSHISVTLANGEVTGATVERVGPIDDGWCMLTLALPIEHIGGAARAYLPVASSELAAAAAAA